MVQGAGKLKTGSAPGGRAKPAVKRGTRVIAPKKQGAVQTKTRVAKYSQSQNGKMEHKLAAMAGNAGAKLKILKQEAVKGDKDRAAELAKPEMKRKK